MRALPAAALVVDATGVGRPIVDQLRSALNEVIAVTITAGKESTLKDGMFYVPKRVLIGALVTALENEQLQIASSLRYAAALVAELQSFRRGPGHRRRQGRLRGGNGRTRRSGGGCRAGGVVGGAPDPD